MSEWVGAFWTNFLLSRCFVLTLIQLQKTERRLGWQQVFLLSTQIRIHRTEKVFILFRSVHILLDIRELCEEDIIRIWICQDFSVFPEVCQHFFTNIFLILWIVERPQWTVGMDKRMSTITAENKENEKVFPQSTLVNMMIWMAQDSTLTSNFLITHSKHK